jgi:hypothetical protein
MTKIVEKPNLNATEYRINPKLKIVKDPNGVSIRIKGKTAYLNLFECTNLDEALDLLNMIESGFLSRYVLLNIPSSYDSNYKVETKGRTTIIYNKVGIPFATIRLNKEDSILQNNIARYIISLKEEKMI